jgi:hypothetical protein
MYALTDTDTEDATGFTSDTARAIDAEDARAIASLAALHLLKFAVPGAGDGDIDEIRRARWYFDRLMSYAPEGDAKCQS